MNNLPDVVGLKSHIADVVDESFYEIEAAIATRSQDMYENQWVIGYYLLAVETYWDNIVEVTSRTGRSFDAWASATTNVSTGVWRSWKRAVEAALLTDEGNRILDKIGGFDVLAARATMEKGQVVEAAIRAGMTLGDDAIEALIGPGSSTELSKILNGEKEGQRLVLENRAVILGGEVILTFGEPASKRGKETIRAVLRFLGL